MGFNESSDVDVALRCLMGNLRLIEARLSSNYRSTDGFSCCQLRVLETAFKLPSILIAMKQRKVVVQETCRILISVIPHGFFCIVHHLGGFGVI